jgi:hypothetical protein
MKSTLVVGRCWKILDFLIPSVDSVINYNDHVDFIIIDNKSTRSHLIQSYCKHLLKNKSIYAYIQMYKNYFGNVWLINKYLLDIYKKYEYLCFTDLDLKIIDPQNNWLKKCSMLLQNNNFIGAVSVQLQRTMHIDHKNDVFIENIPQEKLPNIDFWNINTDGWFYTVRTKDFMEFISCNMGQNGPGMHGYNAFCEYRGLMYGRTNIYAEHLGWLRYDVEYAGAYEETGVKFGPEFQRY